MLKMYNHYHTHQCTDTVEYELDKSISDAIWEAHYNSRLTKRELKAGFTIMVNNILRATYSGYSDCENIAKFEKAIVERNFIDAEEAFTNLPGITGAKRFRHEFIQLWMACMFECYKISPSTILSYREICTKKDGIINIYDEPTKIEVYQFMLRRIKRA